MFKLDARNASQNIMGRENKALKKLSEAKNTQKI